MVPSPSRYREARTLVRRLCPLPGEPPDEYKRKIARLREHFERFNVDASELCQWLMGLRKAASSAQPGPASAANPADQSASFGALGDFLLEPSLDSVEADDLHRDRWRRDVFDDVAGFAAVDALAGRPVPPWLREAMRAAAERPKKITAQQLFERLRALEPAHRLVLLKSAAEWIVARYRRGAENWARQREEWEKEKKDWEVRHPALTPEVRERFTNVFKSLVWDADKPAGVRHKNPRICPIERLRGNIDNCAYAGQKGHGPPCWKYVEFVKARKAKNPGFNEKRFAEDAGRYLPLRRQGLSRHEALRRLFPKNSFAQQRLSDNWTAYLRAMELNEQTVLDHGRLPHCLKIGETYEKSKCQWNPHTELCKQYRNALGRFDAAALALEPQYREWRRDYLAGPRKPQFRYPSSRDLPMPKIFGEGFYDVDFDGSILRLRLDDMRAGERIEFGFIPWPRDYRPSREQIKDRVTSVHVHFVGARARAGFRFDAPHAPSRFGCSQDELDALRSRDYPRRAQDALFLKAARKRLLDSFTAAASGPASAGAAGPLRLLAVDLGETGACAAVYEGHTRQKDVPLEIVKINRLYDAPPAALVQDRRGRPKKTTFERDDPRGLRKEHVGVHLNKMAEGAATIAAHRQLAVATTITLADHDFRGLKRHVAWMIRDWARHNAARVVAAAEENRCDLIVFESLRGFRAPGYDKLGDESEQKKRRLAMFAYGRIRRKVVEKAVERGMRVATVPYFKSSQVCSACGRAQPDRNRCKKNKKQRKFECEFEDCGTKLNSDANAARLLARVFWGEIELPAPPED
jgi:hypothetical protein